MVVASISVALYYNITFFGKALVALPSLPIAAACLFYYLSAFNTTPPVAQVILWMASFVIAGPLWWLGLSVTLQRFAATDSTRFVAFQSRVQNYLWLYAFPLPWLLWVHAQSPNGPSWDALRGAILIRDHLYWTSFGTENWLNVIYLGLAGTESVLTVWAVHQSTLDWKRSLVVVSLASLVALLGLCALAQLLFWIR